ncbi:MAG: hypothetical protein M1832_005913 [Thelocarpon impressellum]|nr:MAG: hypothetical protein M1832_005913 [Thelocarpon impressellum]
MIVEGDQQALANDVHGSLRRTAMRDMPPLPDFPTLKNALIRKANGQPKSGLNTPPASQPVGGSKGNAQEDLKRKEEQIQLMQKRIAELEHRKAKQNGSRAHTPATAHRPQTLVQGSAHPHSSKQVETAMEIDRLIHDTHRQVEENKMALAEAKAAEVRAGAEEAANTQSADPDGLHLKHAEAHLIRQRRAELRSSLQESTSKVELEKKRLAELRKEQEERESLMCQALETKTKLVEELESLGFEASEELCEELEATRKENRGLAKPVTSDDKLLIQMGSVVEGSTPEQREAYKAGLRRALQELDRAEVKDFSTVAARMASYRSEFLQDASRVLVLDGQSRQ